MTFAFTIVTSEQLAPDEAYLVSFGVDETGQPILDTVKVENVKT